MKNTDNQLILLIVLVIAVFALGVVVVGTKSQINHMVKMIEHLNEEVDEAKAGVERLLKRKVTVVSIGENTSELPRVELGDMEYDLGTIGKKDGVVSTDFTITNTGRGELVIGDITTSCGCTSAEVNKSSIMLGESAVLTVNFDPDFHEEPQGRFSRSIFVPTNDPEGGELEFKIFVIIKD
ncbi:MAG: hypothetical protein BMS9Abin13_192 [Patescibacteria group bacterium]|nr:MAG: hypothetical protein BMS9Abin13_192 [Patescibacteria group bacterium]